VRSTNGDARAWLLRPSFSTLKSNDDDSADTRDSHIVASIATAGTYYIAFREKNLEDANFTVSLARKNVVSPGTGRILRGIARADITAGDNLSNTAFYTFGTIWDGYISFDASVVGEVSLDKMTLTDRTGTVYPVNGTRFERLPVPVTVRATT